MAYLRGDSGGSGPSESIAGINGEHQRGGGTAVVVGSCGVVRATNKNKSEQSLCKMDWLVELSINEGAGSQKNRDRGDVT